MAKNISLSCSCGKFRGTLSDVSPARSNFLICGCKSCRAYAHHLERAGDILDGYGGTRIVQISPGRITFTEGLDNLVCLRITPKGPLRWYTSCCNTPVASTLATNGVPFAGVVSTCLGLQSDEAAMEPVFGPMRGRINSAPDIPDTGKWRSYFMMARLFGLMAWWKLRGDARRSPFFDKASGQPVSGPRLLSAEERRAALDKAMSA